MQVKNLKLTNNCIRTIDVLVLVDNRTHPEMLQYLNSLDFRGSGFKQTQIDPLQSKLDLMIEDNLIISNLKKKVQQLNIRVKRLEIEQANDFNTQNQVDSRNKKKRRKFNQLRRDHMV